MGTICVTAPPEDRIPYDGGADVILVTPAERDGVRDRHADWLSGHPAGL
ncbi:DUF3885 domain-containing protein [Streptomyces hyaluromycini]